MCAANICLLIFTQLQVSREGDISGRRGVAVFRARFAYRSLLLSIFGSFAFYMGLFCCLHRSLLLPYTSLSLFTQVSFTFYIHFFCGSLRRY